MSLFSNRSHWIWLSGQAAENCYLQFRHPFRAEQAQPLHLVISAEGQYAAYINGTYLPSTQYPDFPAAKAVQTVTAQGVSEGILEIQVYYPGINCSTTRKETPGLRYELWQEDRLLCASGEDTQVRPLPGYQSGPVAKITPQLGYGVRYAHPEELPWEAAQLSEKVCTPVPRPIPPLVNGPQKKATVLSQGIFSAHSSGLQQYAALSFREWEDLAGAVPKTLPAPQGLSLTSSEGSGMYLLLDLGEETAGYLTLDLTCPENARVEIGYGEHLEDLRVRTDVGGRHFTFHYEAPQDRTPFTHRFHRLAGRYLQVFIYGKEATLYDLSLIPVIYPTQNDGSFSCSDSLHNRIYQVSKATLRTCLHEHYEDCPWREQALYAFDSRNQMLFGYYAFGEFAQPRANLKLLALSQREDGLLELCAPARNSVNIPSFSLAFILALEEYSRFSGDLTLAQELLPTVHRILEAFHGHLHQGTMENFREPHYWNFYEWRPLLEDMPVGKTAPAAPSKEAVLQLYYILALQRTARIYEYLGMQEMPYAADLDIAMQGMEQYWSEEAGAYASFLRKGQKVQYAELTQALALCAGVCPQNRRERLRSLLASGSLVPISLSGSVFKYDALLQDAQRYGALVVSEIADRWGHMLFSGATTMWETDLGAEDFDRAGSLCHAWSSVPIYIYGAYVLGIRPDAPGNWTRHTPISSPILHAQGTFYPHTGPLQAEV